MGAGLVRQADQCQTWCPCRLRAEPRLPAGSADTTHRHNCQQLLQLADVGCTTRHQPLHRRELERVVAHVGTAKAVRQHHRSCRAAGTCQPAYRGNECAYSGTASQETGKCHLLALRRCAFPYRTRYVDRTAISRYTLRRCTPAVACPPSRHPSGRSIAGTGVLCHRCRPLRLLSQHYAGRVCRLDKQYRCRHYQSRTLATECSRLIDTPPLQPWA